MTSIWPFLINGRIRIYEIWYGKMRCQYHLPIHLRMLRYSFLYVLVFGLIFSYSSISSVSAQPPSSDQQGKPEEIFNGINESWKKIKDELVGIKIIIGEIPKDKSNPNITAIIAASGGVFAALLSVFGLIYQQKLINNFLKRSQFVDSLKWFEGKTQKRSIGLAIIEANWGDHKDLQKTWTSVLVNQAIYLLTKKSKDKKSAEKSNDKILDPHESDNRRRIRELLTKAKQKGKLSQPQQEKLQEALESADPKTMNDDEVKAWKKIAERTQKNQMNKNQLKSANSLQKILNQLSFWKPDQNMENKKSSLKSQLVENINDHMKAHHHNITKPQALADRSCTFTNDNRTIYPDIVVFASEYIPPNKKTETNVDKFSIAPDWVIYILASEKGQTKVSKDILYCLKHGTKMGWLIDITQKTIFIYHRKQETEVFEKEDLTLPTPPFAWGLNLKVKGVWDYLSE